jgi:hypothetical protein
MKRLSLTSENRRYSIALYCCMLFLGTYNSANGQQLSNAQTKRAPSAAANKSTTAENRSLDGAWRLVRSLDPASGQLRAVPAGIEMTKLIVGGRFGWIVTQNGRALAGAGGTCSMTANGYTETVSYAVAQNQQPLVGSTTKFTWKFEGERWHHKGTLRVGQARQEIDEIWERIPDR